MSSHVVTSEGLERTQRLEEARGTRDEALEPTWSEYLKFVAAAGAIAGALFLGPMVGMMGMALLVSFFGWLVAG